MKSTSRACLAALLAWNVALVGPAFADGPSSPSSAKPTAAFVFPDAAPADCPFPPSTALANPLFTGAHAEYEKADTWYPSWAGDGNLYSPWTDGSVKDTASRSEGRAEATTGFAKIVGDDPLQLQIVDQGVYASDPSPYAGRYPCGTLVHDGVWYYGTYCLNPSSGVQHDGQLYNWPWLGPLWVSAGRPTSARRGRKPRTRRTSRSLAKPACRVNR